MELIRRWVHTINEHSIWFVSLYKEGYGKDIYWYFEIQNENNQSLIEGYMNGNPRAEPSLAEIMLTFNYIIAKISNCMPLEAKECTIDEDDK